MKTHIALVLLLAALVVLAGGCKALFGGDGGDDHKGGSGSSNDPGDYDGPVLVPTKLDFMAFEYWGEMADGGYNTDVYISDTTTGEEAVYFWVNDATDSIAIDPGTYTAVDREMSGDLSFTDIWVGVVGPTYVEYAASPLDATYYFFNYYNGITFNTYDDLEGGTLTVTVSGDVYTFEWSFMSADGDLVAGSYTGEVDIEVDLTTASPQSAQQHRGFPQIPKDAVLRRPWTE